jgi:hypothetical protein
VSTDQLQYLTAGLYPGKAVSQVATAGVNTVLVESGVGGRIMVVILVTFIISVL